MRREELAVDGQAPSDIPAFQPYWGKPAVRNDRGDNGNVSIIRSLVRAIVLPDHVHTYVFTATARYQGVLLSRKCAKRGMLQVRLSCQTPLLNHPGAKIFPEKEGFIQITRFWQGKRFGHPSVFPTRTARSREGHRRPPSKGSLLCGGLGDGGVEEGAAPLPPPVGHSPHQFEIPSLSTRPRLPQFAQPNLTPKRGDLFIMRIASL